MFVSQARNYIFLAELIREAVGAGRTQSVVGTSYASLCHQLLYRAIFV